MFNTNMADEQETGMNEVTSIGLSALITGSIASAVSSLALAALASAEGKSAVQPTNATSHWFYGDQAAQRRDVDLALTGVGYGTHHASAVFWALPFETWLRADPPRSTADLLGRAISVSALAAVVDYGITPRRFTPGWEHVLSKPSMVGAFASLALGLAAGAAVSNAFGKSVGSDRPQ